MKNDLNCPNCGAPVESDICPYCGSVFIDWASFGIYKDTFIKFRDYSGRLILMKVRPISIEMEETVNDLCGDDWHHVTVKRYRDITLTATMQALPFHHKLSDKEIYCMEINTDIADDETIKTAIGGLQ